MLKYSAKQVSFFITLAAVLGLAPVAFAQDSAEQLDDAAETTVETKTEMKTEIEAIETETSDAIFIDAVADTTETESESEAETDAEIVEGSAVEVETETETTDEAEPEAAND